MRHIKSVLAACFACTAALILAGGSVCSGQDPVDQKELQKAQEFYRAGQRFMLEGDFAAANEEFIKAEIVLRTIPELPAVPAADMPAVPVAGQKKKAAPRDAIDPDIYYNLGVGALQKGDFVQAEAAFQRVLELAPADKDASYNLGILYEKYLDRPADAVKYYTRYINLSDGSEGDVGQVTAWIEDIKERARR